MEEERKLRSNGVTGRQDKTTKEEEREEEEEE